MAVAGGDGRRRRCRSSTLPLRAGRSWCPRFAGPARLRTKRRRSQRHWQGRLAGPRPERLRDRQSLQLGIWSALGSTDPSAPQSTEYNQGATRSTAPTTRASFPRMVTAARTVTFTTSFKNPMRKLIGDTQVKFGIFVPFYNSPNVTARQLHLSVSWHGHRGPFVPVTLTGSTSNTAGIMGVIGGPTGFNLRAHHTLRLSYRIRVSKSVPLRRRRRSCSSRRSWTRSIPHPVPTACSPPPQPRTLGSGEPSRPGVVQDIPMKRATFGAPT